MSCGRGEKYKNDVYVLTKHLDEKLPRSLDKLGVKLTTRERQADRLHRRHAAGSFQAGPLPLLIMGGHAQPEAVEETANRPRARGELRGRWSREIRR